MRRFLPITTLVLLIVFKSMASDKNLPFPFAPPSEAFCKNNILGDDAYLSFFKPCTFTFYKVNEDSRPDHFSCDAYDGTAEVISMESRKVMMWPESCVAAGPRCYSMVDYPDLSTYTIFDDTDNYAMMFPSDASIVSVDCTADYTQAQTFMENLPEELEDVASSIAFGAGVLLFAVLAAIIACICCCFMSCKSRQNPQMHYTPLPSIHLAQGKFVPANQYPPVPTKVVV